MRKRSNVRKRMLAMALSMILTVSLIFGAAPIQVRAEENVPQTETGDPGITDGNQAPENGEQGGGNPEQKPETPDDGQLPNGGGSSEGNHPGEDANPLRMCRKKAVILRKTANLSRMCREKAAILGRTANLP